MSGAEGAREGGGAPARRTKGLAARDGGAGAGVGDDESRRVSAQHRFGVVLREANAARNRAQFPDSNAKTIQTRGIRVYYF